MHQQQYIGIDRASSTAALPRISSAAWSQRAARQHKHNTQVRAAHVVEHFRDVKD
jgi:hypothetical protein